MEFKNLKTDDLALMASLISREAGDRRPALGAALRSIAFVADGRQGEDRPDLRLTIALAAGVEAAIDGRWSGREASLAMLVDDVDGFVSAAARLLDDRHGTIEMLKVVRAALSREVSKARRRGLPYRTLDVSLTPCEARSHDLPTVVIGIEALGPLLDAERIAIDVETADEVKRAFADMREKQEQRLAMRDHLAHVGADVMIDAVTLAALEDAGVDPATAIAELRADRVGIIDVEVRHGRMPFYVRDCVVTGNVPLGDGMRWQDGRLTVPKSRGMSVNAANGAPLKRVLTHSFFDDGCRIDHASEIGDNIWLHVRPRQVALVIGQARKAA